MKNVGSELVEDQLFDSLGRGRVGTRDWLLAGDQQTVERYHIHLDWGCQMQPLLGLGNDWSKALL